MKTLCSIILFAMAWLVGAAGERDFACFVDSVRYIESYRATPGHGTARLVTIQATGADGSMWAHTVVLIEERGDHFIWDNDYGKIPLGSLTAAAAFNARNQVSLSAGGKIEPDGGPADEVAYVRRQLNQSNIPSAEYSLRVLHGSEQRCVVFFYDNDGWLFWPGAGTWIEPLARVDSENSLFDPEAVASSVRVAIRRQVWLAN